MPSNSNTPTVQAHSTFVCPNEYEDLTELNETNPDKTENVYSEDPVEQSHYCYIPEKQIDDCLLKNEQHHESYYLNDPLITSIQEEKILVNNSVDQKPHINESEYYRVPSNQPV
jgi:hypothetical protein